MLRTSVCDDIGIKYPVFSAGMGNVALADLVAAVSNAGACGVLGGTGFSPDSLRAEIRRIRTLTSNPFGVDLLMPGKLPSASVVQNPPPMPAFLRPLHERAESFPQVPFRHILTEELVHRQFQVVIEEKVPLFASGLGTPPWMVAEAHANRTKVIALVGNVKQAVDVEKLGVDYIVAQGHEAGGHTGRIGTMVLVPAVVDAVSIPVIAAGGIGDGRGTAAAFMLGALGVWIGSRFLAAREAHLPQRVKGRIVEADEEATIVTRAYTGKPTRVIRNQYTHAWQGHDGDLLPMPWQALMVEPLVGRAKAAGDLDIPNWPAGQVVGIVRDVKGAGEIVTEITEEASRLLFEADRWCTSVTGR